jgi:hypothetical protein
MVASNGVFEWSQSPWASSSTKVRALDSMGGAEEFTAGLLAVLLGGGAEHAPRQMVKERSAERAKRRRAPRRPRDGNAFILNLGQKRSARASFEKASLAMSKPMKPPTSFEPAGPAAAMSRGRHAKLTIFTK